MHKHQKVAQLVEDVYQESDRSIAHWMWENHLQLVANKAEALCGRFHAQPDLAIAGAYLHDLGDVFTDRHAVDFSEITSEKIKEILSQVGYSPEEITFIEAEVIAPHSCQNGYLPKSLEGKVLATADALAHLTSDFYLQFCWLHIPEGKNYAEYKSWAQEKIERDYQVKIFWPEIKDEVQNRYYALKETFHD